MNLEPPGRYFREAHALVMSPTLPISAVGYALRGRDLLLARALPYLEALLAAQGETPDRALLELQHELAEHLGPAGFSSSETLRVAAPLLSPVRDNKPAPQPLG